MQQKEVLIVILLVIGGLFFFTKYSSAGNQMTGQAYYGSPQPVTYPSCDCWPAGMISPTGEGDCMLCSIRKCLPTDRYPPGQGIGRRMPCNEAYRIMYWETLG